MKSTDLAALCIAILAFNVKFEVVLSLSNFLKFPRKESLIHL
ncbi:hypothetical protein SAMN05192540_1640 [Maribacter dokdonensis]|uniref:Uncharacterized protein n=1 Tax=Maribacter dokdonensis TaxID=320912 RepID=A0A1H4MHM6_9FLAO|nr:hypothetical protein SAMN05192540_1640 [Maribacter dokdonensis]